MAKLTSHQRDTLIRLARMSTLYRNDDGSRATVIPGHDGPVPTKWIHERDCGGPAALEHLLRKGYVERDIRTGPRGGEHAYYRPNAAGWALYDGRATAPAPATPAPPRMTTGEIDTLLIAARRDDLVVRVYVGPARAEIRGYVGHVERGGDDVLRIWIGQRRIAFAAIREVVIERRSALY